MFLRTQRVIYFELCIWCQELVLTCNFELFFYPKHAQKDKALCFIQEEF